ncbi:MAG TPA: hypothetical protein PLH40_05205 [Bacteroidales bacterium]|nr:hypothetical protein [Bacteroidales bacterium]
MKKIILYLLLILAMFKWPAFSQTKIFDESFESDLTGWNFEGNWFQEPGYIFMYYHPVTYNYDFWTISPEFQVPVTGGDLIINHFVDVYQANVTDEKCEILILHNDQEDVVWEYALSNGTWGSIFGTDMLIPLDEFIGETVRVKIKSYGAKSNALWGWFIFNMSLTTFFNYDVEALQLNGPASLNPGEVGDWTLSIKNLGLNPISDITIKLFSYKEHNELATEIFNQSIPAGETSLAPITWSSNLVHNTMLYAVIEHTNDQYSANNKSPSKFLRINPPQEVNILVWDNDNGIETIINPETGVNQQASATIEQNLQEAGLQYSLLEKLPVDLSQYDIVIATMGSHCLG